MNNVYHIFFKKKSHQPRQPFKNMLKSRKYLVFLGGLETSA